jgi:hypothetical protein
MQIDSVSASTAQQSPLLQNLLQQNSSNSLTQASSSTQAAQFNQTMSQLDAQSGDATSTSTTPGSGTPVHHHHGHHHGGAGSNSSSSPADALSALLSQSGNVAQANLPASMTTNTTALDPTSIFGA